MLAPREYHDPPTHEDNEVIMLCFVCHICKGSRMIEWLMDCLTFRPFLSRVIENKKEKNRLLAGKVYKLPRILPVYPPDIYPSVTDQPASADNVEMPSNISYVNQLLLHQVRLVNHTPRNFYGPMQDLTSHNPAYSNSEHKNLLPQNLHHSPYRFLSRP